MVFLFELNTSSSRRTALELLDYGSIESNFFQKKTHKNNQKIRSEIRFKFGSFTILHMNFFQYSKKIPFFVSTFLGGSKALNLLMAYVGNVA